MSDIPDTPLDQCRRALRASEARFRNIIERNADGVVVVSRDGAIRFLNPAAERLFGCRAEDWVGTIFGVPVVPDERTELDLPRGGQAGAVAEMRVTETEWEGEPAYLATLRDITDRKRAEEALKESDRRKDEFLAMLAHELRNPLAPIRNALHLIGRRGIGHPDAEEARGIAERQVEHLTRLVDDLLDVSRITRGKIQLRKQPVDLGVVAARAVEATAALVEARGHTLSVALPRAPVWVDGDPTRLAQVVANLLNNAAKYTGDGGHIELAVAADGAEAVVRVRDDGIGIAPEVLPRVFDLFTQADHALDRAQGGLGIGLTLVRDLVAMHDGSVQAHSAGPGRGSEFVVRLPLLSEPAPEASASASTAAAVSQVPPTDGHPKTVLLVEDQREAGLLMAKVLELWGHRVHVVHDGPTALEAARRTRPDVVLLDIGLPGMDGYEVATRLRSEPGLGRTALVALTGYGQEDDLRRSRQAGFHQHLVKPVDPDSLERLLAQPWAPLRPSDGDGHA